MSAESLAAAVAAHPINSTRDFRIPTRGISDTTGTGRVLGHADTRRGPFVEIEDNTGKIRAVRPANLGEPGVNALKDLTI